jgi:hypothetical protein
MSGGYPLEQPVAFDFDNLTVTNAVAVTLTQSKLNPTGEVAATRVFITCETNAVRYRYDGTAPTTTIGHLFSAGDVLILEAGNNLKNLQFIATGANATISITYESG